jgi:hypothetical protein
MMVIQPFSPVFWRIKTDSGSMLPLSRVVGVWVAGGEGLGMRIAMGIPEDSMVSSSNEVVEEVVEEEEERGVVGVVGVA